MPRRGSARRAVSHQLDPPVAGLALDGAVAFARAVTLVCARRHSRRRGTESVARPGGRLLPRLAPEVGIPEQHDAVPDVCSPGGVPADRNPLLNQPACHETGATSLPCCAEADFSLP